MTKKILKIIPLTILLVVALITAAVLAQQTPQAVPINTKAITVQKVITLPQEARTPIYHHPDSFVLDPYSGVLIGPFTLSSGQEIIVYLTWTPSSAVLYVGYVNAYTGSGYVAPAGGGAALAILNPGPGTWYVVIYNPNPYSVTINSVNIFIVNQ